MVFSGHCHTRGVLRAADTYTFYRVVYLLCAWRSGYDGNNELVGGVEGERVIEFNKILSPRTSLLQLCPPVRASVPSGIISTASERLSVFAQVIDGSRLTFFVASSVPPIRCIIIVVVVVVVTITFENNVNVVSSPPPAVRRHALFRAAKNRLKKKRKKKKRVLIYIYI